MRFNRLKGQAFETMMLVISVIVALAILGVLLNIIGGITLPGGDRPETIMPDGLKEVNSKGYSSGSNVKKATFDAGKLYTAKDIIGQLPIDSGQIKFNCPTSDALVCGANKLTTPSYDGSATNAEFNHRVNVGQKLSAFIAVCGDDTKSFPRYCVGFGSDASKAIDACGKQGDGGCDLFS